jgi:N-methylhydantoinase B
MTASPTSAPPRVDPTTLAVLRRSLINLCNEMGATLAKVAYSPVISEGLDFAGALFDARGHLIACGDHDLTGLLGTLEPTLALVQTKFDDSELQEGDLIVCNLPHDAGNHLNDIRLVKPVFADGELIAFVADVGHWTDVGGSTPGSINPLAHDVYAEGVRIPPLKIVDGEVYRQDLVDLILANVRLPHEANGDLWAQIKALEVGESRLKHLVERYGARTILDVFFLIQEHAEAIFREELSAMRDGTVQCEDWIDMDPLDAAQRPVRVHLKLTKRAGRLTFDFGGSDPQPVAGIGSTWPLTHSGVFVATLNLFYKVPFNHGFIRNLKIITTPATSVHTVFPNPVSGCACGGFEKVIACVLRAIGMLTPTKEVACAYNLINVNLGGVDPRFNRPYVMYLWSEGGFGGGPDRDGGDAPTLTMYAAGSRNQSIEVHERLFPALFTEVEIDQDSGGAGKWRGCPGIRHAYRITGGDAVIGVFGDRKRFRPWGVHKGLPGSNQNAFINRGLPDERELGMAASGVPVSAGDVIEIWSAGGGGYGSAFERDPALVLRDVRLGLVSLEAAETSYGVALECVDELRAEWRINVERTQKLRRTLNGAGRDSKEEEK